MKISTIIPVYNAEKYLCKCLDSVIKQNLNETEIICVDDGSSDSSWEILKTYSRKYNNIRSVRQQNKYAGMARNAGLQMAQGEYVHFLDADDYLFPNTYKEVYECALFTDADYVKFRSRCFSAVTGAEESEKHSDYSCVYLNPNDFQKIISLESHPAELIESSTHVPWAGIFKRSFLHNHNIEFNNLKCVNDRSFYIQVITSTKKITYIDKYVVGHLRGNPESLVGKRGNNFECQFLSYHIIRNYLCKKSSELKYDLYKRILTTELLDILAWYTSLSNGQKERVRTELYKFFLEFDWNEINKNSYICDVMQEINCFLDKDSTITLERLEKLPVLIKKYQCCYLYGAGVVASAMIRYLKFKNIFPDAVIVSSESETMFIEEIRISKIDRIDFSGNDEETIVILATKGNCHLQMSDQLVKRGVRNITTLSNRDFDTLLEMWNA